MLYSRYKCVKLYSHSTNSSPAAGDGAGGRMDCKEFERLIPDFITQKMDFITLKQFNEHMEHCPGCKEELVIQFLVTEGMQRLEEGDAFDMQKELELRLNEAKRRMKFHSSFLRAGMFLEVAAVFMIAGIAIWIIV